MSEINAAIVVVAYNRPKSLSRLLTSLALASYPNKEIDLIISIDNSNNHKKVLEIATSFKWEFGKKTVNYQEINLGLKNHIIKCGDLSQTFGAVVILEDDLYVSPNFYYYTLEAINFAKNKTYIAGISLYNHQLNVHTRDNFTPIEDGFDNWYFQFASSWGQAWTYSQWKGFKEWYKTNNSLTLSEVIPRNVINWSDKSWLKFFITYLIKENKYFLYPKTSVTTNFSDIGTHMGKDSTVYQVPLFYGSKKTFNFSTINNSGSIYDAFFENKILSQHLNISKSSLSIDLYNYKPKPRERYWLTTKIANYKVLDSFARSLRPIDANVISKIGGTDIFLYDTNEVVKNNIKENFNRMFSYKTKHISYHSAFYVLCNLTLSKFRNFIKK